MNPKGGEGRRLFAFVVSANEEIVAVIVSGACIALCFSCVRAAVIRRATGWATLEHTGRRPRGHLVEGGRSSRWRVGSRSPPTPPGSRVARWPENRLDFRGEGWGG